MSADAWVVTRVNRLFYGAWIDWRTCLIFALPRMFVDIHTFSLSSLFSCIVLLHVRYRGARFFYCCALV